MNTIYEPRGKAREYSSLACNLYAGCSHGCVYCYAPAATFKKPQEFFKSKPRPNILARIEQECSKIKIADGEKVLLCFTCDPYQPIDKKTQITRRALQIFSRHNIPVSILSKGGILAVRDFDILSKNSNNEYGATLTCINNADDKTWEPGAAKHNERIMALKSAKSVGISTWVSFEPVLNPEWVYRLIELTQDFVDFYKIGKLNYHPHAKNIDWPDFRANVTELLEKKGKRYMLKKDLIAAK